MNIKLVSTGAAALLFAVSMEAITPGMLREWTVRYQLDPATAAAEYNKLIGHEYVDFVRARMYFEEHSAFELLAYATHEAEPRNRRKIVASLLNYNEYSPAVVKVVVDALEELNKEPEETSGERNAGQVAMKAYMSTALARWLELAEPNVAVSDSFDGARSKYDGFVSRGKQKAEARAKASGE